MCPILLGCRLHDLKTICANRFGQTSAARADDEHLTGLSLIYEADIDHSSTEPNVIFSFEIHAFHAQTHLWQTDFPQLPPRAKTYSSCCVSYSMWADNGSKRLQVFPPTWHSNESDLTPKSNSDKKRFACILTLEIQKCLKLPPKMTQTGSIRFQIIQSNPLD